MADYQTFEVRRIGVLGAVVSGLDLNHSVESKAFDELQHALDVYQVLFFRDQYLEAEQQLALARQFGDICLYPIEKFFGSVEPSQQVIIDDADNPPATDMWHTDVTWLDKPPAVALLSMLEMPEYGGDTMWASTTAAYQALSPSMQLMLDGLVTVHSCHQSFVDIAEEKSGIEGLAQKLKDYYPPVKHPLVRTHPRSGQRSLYITERGVMHHIDGLTKRESDALLDFLDAHISQPRFHIRWKWEPGQFAMWDERTTVHRGVSDHYPQRRVIRRCTVEGEVPFFDADRKRDDRYMALQLD